jgi:putative ABC transport system permease protein
VLALGATRVISKLLFGVNSADPLTFAATALLILVIALAASLIPALRAIKVDPMVALRYE